MKLLGALLVCSACVIPHPSEDSIRGGTPLVIVNRSQVNICELTVQRRMSGIEPVALVKFGHPLVPGDRIERSVGNVELDIIARECLDPKTNDYSKNVQGEVEHLRIAGPTMLGLGGPPDAAAGYASETLALSTAPTPTDKARYHASEPEPAASCLAAGTPTEPYSTKCCGHVIWPHNDQDRAVCEGP